MAAIPTGILSAGFVEQYTRIKSLKDYSTETNIRFVRLEVQGNHPWTGRMIKELGISRQTLIVMVRRGGKLLIPHGSLVLQTGDMVLIYTKKLYRDMQTVEI